VFGLGSDPGAETSGDARAAAADAGRVRPRNGCRCRRFVANPGENEEALQNGGLPRVLKELKIWAGLRSSRFFFS
jgi:hypothetical protein